MMTVPTLLAALTGAALVTSGYLYGARRGRAARETLAAEVSAQTRALALREDALALRDQQLAQLPRWEADTTRLEAMLRLLSDARAADTDELRRLRDELRQGFAALAPSGTDELRRLRDEVREGLTAIAKTSLDGPRLEAAVQKTIAPLRRERDDAAALHAAVRDLLVPLLERARVSENLSHLSAGTTLGELPRMLEEIAERGGFQSVVLSDEGGLPLAASASAREVDALAGAASFLLTFADRTERDGAVRPQAVVVFDQASGHAVHRMFTVDGARFTLTTVSRGAYVPPRALDAALAKLEKTLAKEA